MLHYDRTGVSEGIDINKASATKECHILLLLIFFS